MILYLEGNWILILSHQTIDKETYFVDPSRPTGIARVSMPNDNFSQTKFSDQSRTLSNTQDSPHACGMIAAHDYKAQLFLLGSFALKDSAGQTWTPRGKKSQALLALLALAPRRQRTRVWLRDKLWSESDERKSATSLRQVIFEMRRDMGGMFDAILEIDRHTIALKIDTVWIDYLAIQENPQTLNKLNILPRTGLLEGIDVRDEEFEDWLLLERQIWSEKSDAIFDTIIPEPAVAHDKPEVIIPQEIAPKPALRISVGLLANIQQGCDSTTSHVADLVLEGIAKNLGELHRLDIYDFRDTLAASDTIVGASDTDYFIRVRTLQIRQSLTLTFFFYHADSMSLKWSQSIQTTVDEILNWDNYVIAGFISQNVDRLSKTISSSSLQFLAPEKPTIMAGYTALNMMFRLDRMALENAETLLLDNEHGANDALFSALRTYAASFKVGENLGDLNMATATDTAHLARHALNHNPFNAISLACLGHTMGYVFRDHALGGELLERALNLNQNQAFVWDHYALHKLYSGDYEAAHKAAERAVYLGSYSPISYSYDTTLAMTSTMLGNHQQAIQSSQNALKKQPKFSAAMRYLLVNLASTGQETAAQGVFEHLLLMDPDFKDPEIQKSRFRITEKTKESDLLDAIKRCT